MKEFLPTARHIIGFIISVIAFIVIGCAVSTQFNLAEISALGLAIPLSTRLQTTAQDIVGMAPLFGAIFGTGLLISQIVSGQITRFLPRLRTQIYITAGFVAVTTTLVLMKMVFNITAIAATRSMDGFIALGLVGSLAGYIFAKSSLKRTS